MPLPQATLDAAGMREFRRPRKTPEGGIEGALQCGARLDEGRAVQHCPGRGLRHEAGERGLKLAILRGDLRTLGMIVLSHAAQNLTLVKDFVTRFLGKIGAAEKGLLLVG